MRIIEALVPRNQGHSKLSEAASVQASHDTDTQQTARVQREETKDDQREHRGRNEAMQSTLKRKEER